MTNYKQLCPYCKTEISFPHFLEHLLGKHILEVLEDKSTNIPRLTSQQDKPYGLIIDAKKQSGERHYYCCLGCMSASIRPSIAEKHFPECKDKHREKCLALLKKYKELVAEREETPLVVKEQPIVTQGWTDEQVMALLGSMLSKINKNKVEEEYQSRVIRHYEEAIKDLPEETQEEINDELPDYPEDNEVEFDKASDVNDLYNLATKMGFRLDDVAIPEAYQKWNKMPPKKLKKV